MIRNVIVLGSVVASTAAISPAQASQVYLAGNDAGVVYSVNFEGPAKCRLYWRPGGANLFSFSASSVVAGGTFVFSSPNFEPLGPGAHKFFFRLTSSKGEETLSYGVEPLTFPDGVHGYRFAYGADLLRKLAQARTVTLAMSDGRELKDVSLSGSSHAIKALEQCAGQFEPTSIGMPDSAFADRSESNITARCVNSRAVFSRGNTKVGGGECDGTGAVYYRARTFADGRTIILQTMSSEGMINSGTAIFIAEDGTARTYEDLYVSEWYRIWSPNYLFYARRSTGADRSPFNPYTSICEITYDWAQMKPIVRTDERGEIYSSCADPI